MQARREGGGLAEKEKLKRGRQKEPKVWSDLRAVFCLMRTITELSA